MARLHPDVVLMDVRMRKMDGLEGEFTPHSRRLRIHQAVLLLTNHATAITPAPIEEAGADDLLEQAELAQLLSGGAREDRAGDDATRTIDSATRTID